MADLSSALRELARMIRYAVGTWPRTIRALTLIVVTGVVAWMIVQTI